MEGRVADPVAYQRKSGSREALKISTSPTQSIVWYRQTYTPGGNYDIGKHVIPSLCQLF